MFEDFLKTFKSTTVDAADQLEGLNIGEDAESDEYDFMDEDEESANRTRNRDRNPKQKYIQMLQDVADRARSEIQIDLDDLDTVRSFYHLFWGA